MINIKNDTLKEFLTEGAEQCYPYGMPILKRENNVPKEVIAFSECMSCQEPEGKYVHFFIDDYKFERLWNNPKRYLDILKRYDGVISPDFSIYSGMPKALQVYNVYRNRALAYWLQSNGIKIIATVSWCDYASMFWSMDGIPQGSNVAISTNGCFHNGGKEMFLLGIKKIYDIIDPKAIIIVGREIEFTHHGDVYYYDSFGQKLTKKLRGE